MIAALAMALAFQEADDPIIITGSRIRRPGITDVQPIVQVDEEVAVPLVSGRLEEALLRQGNIAFFRRADSRSVHPTAQGITARGLGGNAASRMAIYIDDIPQDDPFGGWINLAAIDPIALSHVDIHTGPATEPGGIAGRIQMHTDERPDERAEFAFSGGGQVDAALIGSTRLGNGSLAASASYRRGDGFSPIVPADRGAADRDARSDQANMRIFLAQELGGLDVETSVSFFHDERDRGFDGSENRSRGLDLGTTLRADVEDVELALALWWKDRDFRTRFAALDDDRDSARVVLDQYDVPARGYGTEGWLLWNSGALDGTFGAGWRGNEASLAERFFFVADVPQRERRAGGNNSIISLFGDVAARQGKLEWTVIGRMDHWRIDDGFRTVARITDNALLEDSLFDNRSGTELSGGSTIAYRAGALEISLGVGKSWRLPTLNELYRPFRVGADATAANAMLNPEQTWGLSSWMRWQDGEVEIAAEFFLQRLDHAIANVPLATGPGLFPGVGFVAPGGTYAQRQNLDGIETHGVTLNARWRHSNYRVDLSYGYANPRIDGAGPTQALDGNRPPQSPVHGGSLSLGWDESGKQLSVTTRLDGKRYNDLANSEELDAALSLDAYASWPIAKGFSLEARAENLTDARILSDIQSDGTRERARGRTVWIGVVFD